MAKQQSNTKVIIIVFAVILLIVLFNSSSKLPLKYEEDVGALTVHYYKDGVEVFPNKQTFSIITPPGGVYDQIAIDVKGIASGDKSYSNIKVVGATPLAFKSALPTTTQTLTKGQTKILWTSGLMNTAQFESLAQPVRFWVNVSAKDDYDGSIKYSNNYVDLTINPEGLAGWCYQEHANVVTSCGGLSTGKYYLTQGVKSGGVEYYGELYINYSKPAGATNLSLWRVKSTSADRNITLNRYCFAQSKLQLMVRAWSNSKSTNPYFYCWNGTGWYYLSQTGAMSTTTRLKISSGNAFYDGNWLTSALYYNNTWMNSTNGFWEEGMWWR